MKLVPFIMVLLLASFKVYSHPICSDEDGVFKFITAREDRLTQERVSEYLDIIKQYSITDMEGKWDQADVAVKINFIKLYFEKKQLERMVKEGRVEEINDKGRAAYCTQIGKLPKLHNREPKNNADKAGAF